jgi:cellobiose transport system permease protein
MSEVNIQADDKNMPSAQEKVKGLSAVQRINRTGIFFVLPFLIIYAIFNMYPILYSLWLSFFSWNGLSPMKPIGFANYSRLFTTDPYFFKSIFNTLIILVGYLPLTVFLALILASLLNSKLIRGQHFFQTAWFLPYIVAAVSIAMLFRILFDWSSGAINGILLQIGAIHEGLNWLGDPILARITLVILLVWSSLGYVTTLFLAGIINISQEIIDAAEVDGANYFQKLFHVIIPLLKPVILFVTLTGTISCIQLYDAPRILMNPGMVRSAIGGPERSVLTAVWYMVDTSMGGSTGNPQIGYSAAISYGLFLITAVFSFLNYKMINRGGQNYD